MRAVVLQWAPWSHGLAIRCPGRADLHRARGELSSGGRMGGGAQNAGNAAGQEGDACRAGHWPTVPGSPGRPVPAGSPQANIGETLAQWANGQAIGECPRQGTQNVGTHGDRWIAAGRSPLAVARDAAGHGWCATPVVRPAACGSPGDVAGTAHCREMSDPEPTEGRGHGGVLSHLATARRSHPAP